MEKWEKLADRKKVDLVMERLNAKGINAYYAEDGKEALDKMLELIPEGSEVFEATSTTLQSIGFTDIMKEGKRYVDAVKQVREINDPTERDRLRRKTTIAQFAVGSVHAVTEDGELIAASMSGSQLAPYVYTAERVVLVAGTHKIVNSVEEGIKRIKEHTVPLENKRMMAAYGIGTALNKLLIMYGDKTKGRISIIFVNRVLGF
jgi:hypothetical protein